MFCADPAATPSPPHSAPSTPSCHTARDAEAIAPCGGTPWFQKTDEPSTTLQQLEQLEDPERFVVFFVTTFNDTSQAIYCAQLRNQVMWGHMHEAHARQLGGSAGERGVTASLMDKLCAFPGVKFDRSMLQSLHKKYQRISHLLATSCDRLFWHNLADGGVQSSSASPSLYLSKNRLERLAAPAVRLTWIQLTQMERLLRWRQLLCCDTPEELEKKARGQLSFCESPPADRRASLTSHASCSLRCDA
jgi:hypothetical protein